MDNSHSEQEPPKIKLSDFKKIHKTAEEIANDIKPKKDENPVERRKFIKRIWDKLIPREQQHKKDLQGVINEGEIDLLTGIYNRKGFERRLDEEIARLHRAEREGNLANSIILSIDANKLKEINDSKGHAGGDKYLQELSLALSESVRPTDVVARYGGDEFAVLLPGANYTVARELFDTRLKKNFGLRGITASIGAYMIDPSEDIQVIEDKADQAMYQAKKLSKASYDSIEYREHGENIR